MPKVLFYHLTRSTILQTAANLLPLALNAGWRVMIRGAEGAVLGGLDSGLWQALPFLPHGVEGGSHDARQPVLLGTGPITNNAQVLMLLDGALPIDHEMAALERIWILFEDSDAALKQSARLLWKQLTEQGLHAQYWSEEGGRWQMLRETAPK